MYDPRGVTTVVAIAIPSIVPPTVYCGILLENKENKQRYHPADALTNPRAQMHSCIPVSKWSNHVATGGTWEVIAPPQG